jgi:hypothetical protein
MVMLVRTKPERNAEDAGSGSSARSGLLARAVTPAISGFHFRKVFEKQHLNQQLLKGGLLCR